MEAARVWDTGDFVILTARESGRGKISGVPLETDPYSYTR